MERLLRLPDNRIVKDEGPIDTLLDQRRSVMEKRKQTPPPVVLKGVDLNKAKLVPGQRKGAGTLEIDFGSREPFKNELYEIPDLEIDLTPGDDEFKTPERIMHYDLIEGSKKISIDVLFDETYGEYWDHYGDEKTIEALVRKNLLEALRQKNWKHSWIGAWSVVK